MIADYSQAGEQTRILEWADGQPHAGSFVDLGCYDGVTYSNTAALAERGWSGICIDAAPDAAERCADRYADRADIEVILAAFTLDDADTTTISWTAGQMYTSFTASQRDDVQVVDIEVPRLNLASLAVRIAELPPPLFCSIDLEGVSLEALAWLLEYAHPECVCVEANNPGDRELVREFLHGWVEMPVPNEVNLVFRR